MFEESFDEMIDSTRIYGDHQISKTEAVSGENSFKLDATNPFLEAVNLDLDPLTNDRYSFVHATLNVKIPRLEDVEKTYLIISNEDEGGLVQYMPVILDSTYVAGTWTAMTNDFLISPVRRPNLKLKIYLWHDGQGEVFADDFSVILSVREPID